MTIRNRLTLVSSLTFGVVFAVAAWMVYYMFHASSERIIFSELQKTGLLSAMFYLEEDELPVREHNRIRADFEAEMQQTDVKVYDAGNNLRYGNGQLEEQLTPATLGRIREAGKMQFEVGGYYYFGMHYPDNQGDFVVVVATSNAFFASQSNQILLMMAVALGVGLVIIFLLSSWLSKVAYRPISSVIGQVSALQADTLEQALSLPRSKDELYDLINTFNGLLLRLSETFVIQRNFINYISHEFKTPLAAITGHLEVFGQRDRSPEEYRQVSQTVLGQVSEMEQIMNSLMVLAGLRTSPQSDAAFRVDEVIWDVLERVFEKWPHARLLINAEVAVEVPEKLKVKGNVSQIQMAIYNLIDNAVKYANEKPVTIRLDEHGNASQLTIQDRGVGISQKELKLIHQPFYRGSNVGNTKGSGIGLSLAVLICKQNGISFSLASEKNRGTTVQLAFNQF